jgi:Ca2+-transporting ATPase
MAAASLRCVAFAYRTHEMDDVPDEDQRAEWKLPEDSLIMLGIVGIKVHNIFESFDCC